ncbi:MAG: hypothetical protein Q7R93_05195 [bacterium]|nr:hypothetical protein [bacterium]
MKDKFSFEWIGLSLAVLVTTATGLIPTWVLLLGYWLLPLPKSLFGKSVMLSVVGIIWAVVQFLAWISAGLMWDHGSSEFNKRVLTIHEALPKLALQALGVILLIKLCMLLPL